MNATLLEKPPQRPLGEPNDPSPKTQSVVLDQAPGWIGRMILKSYMSSFHFCLTELGWVPKSILEIGFGDGELMSYVARTYLDARIVGVEFDAKKIDAIRNASCGSRLELVELMDLETLPFDDGEFDLVISHGFLASAPVPRHWVKEMNRVSAEAVIVSAQSPIGTKWLKKFPGSEQTRLVGNPVFADGVQPIPMRQLRYWMTGLGMQVEAATTPAPFGMILARKPQPQK